MRIEYLSIEFRLASAPELTNLRASALTISWACEVVNETTQQIMVLQGLIAYSRSDQDSALAVLQRNKEHFVHHVTQMCPLLSFTLLLRTNLGKKLQQE